MYRLIIRLLVPILALLSWCSLPVWSEAKEPVQIVATTGMVGDIVRNIAGEIAEVEVLMGTGVDPHLYKPTRTDIVKLTGADMVFYNGLLLEGKMTDALIRVASSGRKVFAVTEGLDPEALLEPVEFQGHYDPHVWMDPLSWVEATRAVESELKKYMPQSNLQLEQSSKHYMAELKDLNSYAKGVLDTVPEKSRILVTAHDAFNYFGRRYGFQVMGIQGLSTESEAGVRDIENLVEVLVKNKIRAVFIESTVSEKNINALIAGAAAKGHKVTIGGSLFSDAMGGPGTYEGSYIGMIDHNVTIIARALGGKAPQKGWKGKLTGIE